MKKALIVGATGLIGQHCLAQLLADNHYQKITAIVRRPLDVSSDKLEQVIADFNQLTNYLEQLNVDDVFCCLGTTLKTAGSKSAFRQVDFDYVLQLAKLAHQQRCKQFLLVSSLGANHNSRNFYLKVKGQVEQALKDIGFDGLHIFQPSLLIGKRQEFRFSEHIAQLLAPVYNPLMIGSLAKYRAIDAHKVADAMINIAKQQTTGIHTYPNDRILSNEL